MTRQSGGEFSSSLNVAESLVWAICLLLVVFFFNADLQTIQQR